ncbi:MAG: hypothetical protein J7M25_00090 [Deltaproteobacteria bacterium]|nr:hypothetical protein [Deltaproteobacteria bacterium]
MLVVLSDLHFQQDPHGQNRNLESRSLRMFFEEIARAAKLKQAKDLTIVLNGDIFDYIRNQAWFVPGKDGGALRPYAELEPSQPLSDALEERVWAIHQSIEQDPRVQPSIALLEAIAHGTDDIFTEGVHPKFLFIPGTSDRLADMSVQVKSRLYDMLNLPGSPDDPFPRQILFTKTPWRDWPHATRILDVPGKHVDYGTLIQHGHEYDWTACEFNYDDNVLGRTPEPADAHLYRMSSLSDWIAIDVIGRLAKDFLDDCGGDASKLIPENQFIYDCLMEADDVRPQLRVLSYLLWRLEGDPWLMIRELVRAHLVHAAKHQRLRQWLSQHDQSWLPDRADKIRAAVKTLASLSGAMPDSFLAGLGKRVSRRAGPDTIPLDLLRTDPIWQNPEVHFICHGHFHEPGSIPLGVIDGHPKLAVCTGTWRRRHRQGLDEISHVAIRSMGYSIFYRPDEQTGNKAHRMEFWQGQVVTHQPDAPPQTDEDTP